MFEHPVSVRLGLFMEPSGVFLTTQLANMIGLGACGGFDYYHYYYYH